jgi:hypothetical protein
MVAGILGILKAGSCLPAITLLLPALTSEPPEYFVAQTIPLEREN